MDFLIKNGTVYDPIRHTKEKRDLAIADGRITAPKKDHIYRQTIDAAGCIVTAGLIDYHVHYMLRGSDNGVNGDASSFCNGITTAVDGGTTGTGAYELYRNTIVANSEVRLLNYLLVASGGQSNNQYPENVDPAFFDEERILSFFDKYRDNLVALKTRISRNIIAPELAVESVQRTVELAGKAKTRVVVHVTDCSIPLDRLAELLRPGDVICHIYHGEGHICIGRDGKVLPGLWEARRRGVLFDACNGKSNFDIEVCRTAIREGFLPDVISSDNNTSSWFLQPMHSLPRILSKFIDFGMSWEEVLDRATIAPAKLIGMPELASMEDGTVADISIFKLKRKELLYSDINGHQFIGHQVLVPQMTFKGGKCMYCQVDFA